MRHPDLYQLLAYTVAAGVPGGLLVYAAGECDHAVHTVTRLGKRLEVVPLDLSGQPNDILAQIKTLSNYIRDLRAQAVGLESVRSAYNMIMSK